MPLSQNLVRLSNALGIAMKYASAQDALRDRRGGDFFVNYSKAMAAFHAGTAVPLAL